MAVPAQERVVFGSVFEALARIVAVKNPELEAPLKQLGIDVHNLQAAYPVETWKAATDLVSKALFPEFLPQIAACRLGRVFIESYFQTLIGKALGATLKLLGPTRSFGRVSRSFRTGNNFTEDRVVQHAPNDYELWLNEVHVPHVNQGVLQGGLEVIGAKQCSVEIEKIDAEGVTYRCRWQ
jgi:uncharacterized protein (TIGR02265 family)